MEKARCLFAYCAYVSKNRGRVRKSVTVLKDDPVMGNFQIRINEDTLFWAFLKPMPICQG